MTKCPIFLAYAYRVSRPWFRRTLAALAFLFLSGCRADVTVAIRATAQGSGAVTATLSLDEAAASALPDMAKQLRVSDLEAASWRITGPTPAPGGRTEVSAVKEFASPAHATLVIQELSGVGGPFDSLRLTRTRSLFKTRTSLTGAVDLTAGLAAFSDAIVKERLGGQALGVEPGQIAADLGKPLDEVFGIRLTADLPGDADTDGTGSVWRARVGEKTSINAVSEQWNLSTIGFGSISVLSGLFLVVTLIRRRRHP